MMPKLLIPVPEAARAVPAAAGAAASSATSPWPICARRAPRRDAEPRR